MKQQQQIQKQATLLIQRELDRRVVEAQKRLPHLCCHNYRHPLDTRQKVEGVPNPGYNRITQDRHLPVLQTIGLCLLEENDLRICEDPQDAKRCPLFSPLRTKKELYDLLVQDLSTPEWLQKNMPELYTLLWVLGEAKNSVQMPWWKRLWFWAKRIKVEPLSTYQDPSLLLPPVE